MPRNRFTQEFTVKNLLLTHPTPNYFVTSQWRWPRIIYVLYRVVAALYFLVWLVLSGAMGGSNAKFFIYLTNWTFLMLTLRTVVMALTAIYDYIVYRNREGQDETYVSQDMPWYLKAQWVIYNISTLGSFVVTLAYWSLLWKPGQPVGAFDFTVHAFNSIYVMLDLFITATPVRLLHVWHVLVYGSLYIIFTLIYCGAGGTDPGGNSWIYPVLDFYGKPVTAVVLVLVAVFVAVPLLWLLIFGLVALRVFLSDRYCSCCGRNFNNREAGDLIWQWPPIEEHSASPTDAEKATSILEGTGKFRPIFTVEAANGDNTTDTNSVVNIVSTGAINTAFESEQL